MPAVSLSLKNHRRTPSRVDLRGFVQAAEDAQYQSSAAYRRACPQTGEYPRVGAATSHPPDSEDAIKGPAGNEPEAEKHCQDS